MGLDHVGRPRIFRVLKILRSNIRGPTLPANAAKISMHANLTMDTVVHFMVKNTVLSFSCLQEQPRNDTMC